MSFCGLCWGGALGNHNHCLSGQGKDTTTLEPKCNNNHPEQQQLKCYLHKLRIWLIWQSLMLNPCGFFQWLKYRLISVCYGLHNVCCYRIATVAERLRAVHMLFSSSMYPLKLVRGFQSREYFYIHYMWISSCVWGDYCPKPTLTL